MAALYLSISSIRRFQNLKYSLAGLYIFAISIYVFIIGNVPYYID